MTSGVCATSWGDDRIDIFYKSTDDVLCHRYWNGINWSEEKFLGGDLRGTPAACSSGPDRIDIFARGTDNALWYIWWDGNNWSDW